MLVTLILPAPPPPRPNTYKKSLQQGESQGRLILLWLPFGTEQVGDLLDDTASQQQSQAVNPPKYWVQHCQQNQLKPILPPSSDVPGSNPFTLLPSSQLKCHCCFLKSLYVVKGVKKKSWTRLASIGIHSLNFTIKIHSDAFTEEDATRVFLKE